MLVIPCRGPVLLAGRPFRPFVLNFPVELSVTSAALCFAPRLNDAPFLVASLSLMSWLWLLVARAVRF